MPSRHGLAETCTEHSQQSRDKAPRHIKHAAGINYGAEGRKRIDIPTERIVELSHTMRQRDIAKLLGVTRNMVYRRLLQYEALQRPEGTATKHKTVTNDELLDMLTRMTKTDAAKLLHLSRATVRERVKIAEAQR